MARKKKKGSGGTFASNFLGPMDSSAPRRTKKPRTDTKNMTQSGNSLRFKRKYKRGL